MAQNLQNYIPTVNDENNATNPSTQTEDIISDNEGDELDFYYYPPELQITNLGIGAEIEALQSSLSFSIFSAYQDEFASYMSDLKLRYFKASEFLFLGGGHYSTGRCGGLNSLPPKTSWPSVRPIAKAIDEIRHRLGAPVIMMSIYRDEDYNSCIGGVPGSFHKQFKAIDFRCLDGKSSSDWAAVAHDIRAEEIFTGGVGLYNTFVHIDNRGSNVDF